MAGTRLSVRLPSRIVPIWVSEPIGSASFLRMARTPAMKVVATAPMPGRSTPSLPDARFTSTPFLSTIGLLLDSADQVRAGTLPQEPGPCKRDADLCQLALPAGLSI